jgi:hypothetical protein
MERLERSVGALARLNRVASRMQRQERKLARTVVSGAFSALLQPFLRAVYAPASAFALLRSRRSIDAAARARFDTRKWTPELLKHLEWRRFEELCEAYFEALGSGGAPALVHCKPWNAYRVGIKPVRDLRGAMAAAGVGQGVLITAGRFTQEAQAYAAQGNIELIDGASLLARLSSLVPERASALLKLATRGDFLTPTCPSCGIKMTSRKSTQGGRNYWGCTNYPRCKQTFSASA